MVHFLAGLFLAQLAGCSRHADEGPAPEPAASVTVEPPKKRDLERTILQPGYARPYEQTPIYARVQGYVDEVAADLGDHPKEGQLLARLRVPELEQDWKSKSARAEQAMAQVKQAAEGLEAARANVETAKASILDMAAAIAKADAEQLRWQTEYERGQKFLAEKVYDKQTLDEVLYQWRAALAGREQAKAKHQFAKAALIESQARAKKAAADLEAAESSVKVAAADRDQAKVWYDYRNIRAPYAGVITQRNVHPGQFLQVSSSGSTNKSAEPLFNLVNLKVLRITVQVPEYDASLVKADFDAPTVKGYGSPAVVTFQGLNDREIKGRVTRKADLLDNQSRTMKVEIFLQNQGEKLLPGMYVNAAIHVVVPDTWTLPVDAVFTDGEKTYCFIVEGGKAVKTALQTGVRNDFLVEILRKRSHERHEWVAVTGGEQVVSANPESLIDGQNVTIAPAK